LDEAVRGIYKESGYVLESRARLRIADYRKVEAGERFQKQIEFFRDKIPGGDMHMLKACIYTVQAYETGNPAAWALKQQLCQTYGNRGRNLCNLCSAGYLDTWLRPTWEELESQDAASAKERFQSIYNTLLNELPWTVFVYRSLPEEDLLAQVTAKMDKNAQYGVRWMKIHGIGQDNLAKIRAVVTAMESHIIGLSKTITEENNRISVRLELPSSTLPPADVEPDAPSVVPAS
jgi:hypothetical protein